MRVQQHIPAPVMVPSPPSKAKLCRVGGGCTGRYLKLIRERGDRTLRPHLWRPLSRLRFAQAPSPTKLRFAALGGEGIRLTSFACRPS